MPIEHEQKLRDFAQRAAKLAEQTHQDWGSATDGGLQVRVNVDMPKHGSDHALLNVENLLGALVGAIGTYLRRPPAGCWPCLSRCAPVSLAARSAPARSSSC
jgi:hypothetical protein